MDAREFYAQLDKADDELNAVSGDLYKIFSATDHLQYIFSDLAEKASNRLNEISEECYKLSGEIDKMREGLDIEADVMADVMAEEEKKKPSN